MVHKSQTSYHHTLDKGSSVLIWSLPFVDYATHFHLDVRNLDLGATVVLTFRWPCNSEMECVFSPLIASSFFLDYTTHYHLDIRNMDLGATVVLTLRWPCNPETEYIVLPHLKSPNGSFISMIMHHDNAHKVQSTNNLLCFISSEGLDMSIFGFSLYSSSQAVDDDSDELQSSLSAVQTTQ